MSEEDVRARRERIASSLIEAAREVSAALADGIPHESNAVSELARLREGLHKFRYALDSRTGRETTTDFIRAMLDDVLKDPGEPCDRDEQYARAEQAEDLLRVAHATSNKSEAERVRAVKRAEAAEAAVARVRAEAARIRAVTPTWGPVADLIDAALAGTSEGPTPEPRLLDCGWCFEEQGEEVHPHPECPIGARRGPIVGTARITVYVQAAGGGLDSLDRHAADVSRRKEVGDA